MNKFLNFSLKLLVLSLFIFSCQKEEAIVQKAEEIDYLTFPSRDAFEGAITSNKIPTNARFISMEQAKKSNLRTDAEDLKIEIESLEKLINSNGIVQIGKWIFRLNGKTRTVNALSEENKQYFGQLKKGEVVPGIIYTFSFDDDVLDLLENGFTSSPTLASNQKVQLFCGEKGVSTNHIDRVVGPLFNPDPWVSINRGIARVDYYKGGIYFELRAYGGVIDRNDQRHMYKKRTYWVDPKCRGTQMNITEGYVWCTSYINDPYEVDRVAIAVHPEKIYASTTALQRYRVIQSYSYRDNATGTYKFQVNQDANHGF